MFVGSCFVDLRYSGCATHNSDVTFGVGIPGDEHVPCFSLMPFTACVSGKLSS